MKIKKNWGVWRKLIVSGSKTRETVNKNKISQRTKRKKKKKKRSYKNKNKNEDLRKIKQENTIKANKKQLKWWNLLLVDAKREKLIIKILPNNKKR